MTPFNPLSNPSSPYPSFVIFLGANPDALSFLVHPSVYPALLYFHVVITETEKHKR